MKSDACLDLSTIPQKKKARKYIGCWISAFVASVNFTIPSVEDGFTNE